MRRSVVVGAVLMLCWCLSLLAQSSRAAAGQAAALRLNELEYLEMPGLNVMLAHDYYPEGHQGGVGIIQNGLRVATNGDIRLDRTPGQWQPVPKVGTRVVDRATGEISLRAEYPDESKNRKGFNPVEYPDLRLSYTVRVRPEGGAFRIIVDLDAPLPDEWAGQVRIQPGALPRHPLREDVRHGDAGGRVPAAAERAWRDRQARRVPARADGRRPPPRRGARVGPAADGHRGRDRRRPRTGRRPRAAHQRLVRGPLADRPRRDEGRRELAGDAPRDRRLDRAAGGAGVAGRLSPDAAEMGGRRTGSRRRAPPAHRAVAHLRKRGARTGPRTAR